MGPFNDIVIETTGHVALIEIRRPPHNFFDIALIQEISTALEALDEDINCRAAVLALSRESDLLERQAEPTRDESRRVVVCLQVARGRVSIRPEDALPGTRGSCRARARCP